MANAISTHLKLSLSGCTLDPSDQRRINEFIRMLGEKQFQLAGALEDESEHFYNDFNDELAFFFAIEAHRCGRTSRCLHYEKTPVWLRTGPMSLKGWVNIMRCFIRKYDTCSGKDPQVVIEQITSLPKGMVHGVWMISVDPSRPADMTTHLLVPIGTRMKEGLAMLHEAVEENYSPF